MGLLRWIPGFFLATLAVLFAVNNREAVIVHWSPMHDPLTLPLYIVVLGLTAIGFITGGLITWLNMLPLRFELRKEKKRAREFEERLEKEIEKNIIKPVRTYTEDNKPEKSFLPALNFKTGFFKS